MKNETNPMSIGIKLGIGFVILLLIVAILPIYVVGVGHRAVEFNKISGLKEEVYEEGLHWKIPIIESVHKFDVRTVKGEMTASAASKDLQIVKTEIALNYKLQEDSVWRLYQEVGKDFESRIIAPAIQEAVKAVTAEYTAEELITKRPEVGMKIQDILTERLGDFYITVQKMSIVNFDFSDEFNKAIEAKQEAEQLALKAEQDLRRVEFEAAQELAIKQAEAEGLRLQKDQITKELIELRRVEMQLKWVEQWNGVMPTFMMSGNSPDMLLNMPMPGTE